MSYNLVYYEGNADPNVGTGALSLDGRLDLQIGAAGYVTDDELRLAAAHGVTLQSTTEKKLKELNVPVPDKPEAQPKASAPATETAAAAS